MPPQRLAEIAAPLEHYDFQWANTPVRWQGVALGTEVSLILDAPNLAAEAALQHAADVIEHVQNTFNLYDDNSLLGQLNLNGTLLSPPPDFLDLCELVTRVHVATGGLFDPTIQPLWRSLSTGQNMLEARQNVGWKHVEISPSKIQLRPGQQLSFNGIAQGFATDLICRTLRELGIHQALVQVGEIYAIGGPFDLTLAPPAPLKPRHLQLTDSAVCISRPSAHLVGSSSHILHPFGQRLEDHWDMVTVRSSTTAIADAAATAFTMMDIEQIVVAKEALPELNEITLTDHSGADHII